MKDLFGVEDFDENKWEDHYVGMPDYDNVKESDPKIVAKFKFRNKEDFEKFNALLKEHVFNCNKIFDGTQRKNDYQSWFPHKEKGSDYVYE